MKLHLKKDGVFFVSCSFEERHLPKQAGFRWSDKAKAWYTPQAAIAARLKSFAVDRALSFFEKAGVTKNLTSMPQLAPPPGLELKPFQVEALGFALSRNKSYLRLDPGLGKGVCAARIVIETCTPTVYVTPPSLVENVRAEFEKWAPEATVHTLKEFNRTKPPPLVLIMPESQLAAPRYEALETLQSWKLMHHCANEFILIVDEAHHFNNPSAKRTKALFKLVTYFDRLIFMSGTPMPNRPIELYSVLSHIVPAAIDHMSKFEYGRKYCGGYLGPWGWDFSGASNLEELNRRLVHPTGDFMFKLTKEELDLPPKIEEVVVLSDTMSPQLATLDKGLGARYSTADDLVRLRIADATGKDPEHVATYRRLLGQEKVKRAVEFIEMVLAETKDNLLVFAFHRDVIKALVLALKAHRPILITGETPVSQRHELVKEYQTSKDRRLFIGNYVAMGHGFTLTKADREIFVEFDWTPGVNLQASDRAHRIGRVGPVLVQYMVLKNSLDKLVIETLLKKRKVTSHI